MTRISYQSLCQWLVIIGAFLERWYEIAILLLVNVIIITIAKTFYINKVINITAILIVFWSIISITILGYGYNKFVQQFILLYVVTACYYNFFYYIQFNIEALFEKYIKYIYILSLVGLFQFIVFVLSGINVTDFLYQKGSTEVASGIIRITSILREPSQFSCALTPAIVYILFVGSKRQLSIYKKVVLFLTVILTFSTITYCVLVIALIYKYFIYYNNISIRLTAVCILFFLIINGIFTDITTKSSDSVFAEIVVKLDDSISGIKDIEPQSFELLNLSSYATLSNIWVALNAPLRITGTGLGTHYQNYYSTYISNFQYYGQNADEAYSLATRLYSEFGLLGFLLIMLLLMRNFNKNSAINIAVAFLILSQLIRGGHYMRYGLVMYFFIYYYSGYFYSKNMCCRMKCKHNTNADGE